MGFCGRDLSGGPRPSGPAGNIGRLLYTNCNKNEALLLEDLFSYFILLGCFSLCFSFPVQIYTMCLSLFVVLVNNEVLLNI